jgi:hypothetical protein
MDEHEALAALADREPIFHRSPPRATRADFEAMIAPDYWEVGASGAVYSRDVVLDILEARYADPAYDPMEGLAVRDLEVRAVGWDAWLVTYHLDQGERRTRRSTLWRHDGGRWVALYHQGTVIAGRS